MMFWQEDGKSTSTVVNEVVDLGFRLEAKTIALDHAEVLAGAMLRVLPWLSDEVNAGIHMIHVAASGNGWLRPDNPDSEVLCLSKRTRLHIRIPKNRVADADHLTGTLLTIGDADIMLGQAQVKPLVDSTTVFSRYIVSDPEESENDFMQRQAQELAAMGINVKKMLCGMTNVFKIGNQAVYSKSMMLAELASEESLLLQEKGLGPLRLSGFGLFNSHKGIAPVMSANE